MAAYEATTGKLKWRLWTIPGPGEFGSDELAGRFLFAWRRHNLDAWNLRPRTETRCIGPPATPRPISSEIRGREMTCTPPASWQSTPLLEN